MIRSRKRPVKTELELEDEAPPVLEPEPNAEVEFQDYDSNYEYIDENGYPKEDQNVVEFNFVDRENVSCGICNEIVPYASLFNVHLANQHPEFSDYTLEDASSYDVYGQQAYEQKPSKNAFPIYNNDPSRPIRSTRTLRRVSQIRVNTQSMSLDELENALRRKMVEKMGRKIPVSLVDKEHAKCGICSAVLSLNRKFEVVHLIRHFNAWHPSEHKCSGEWIRRSQTSMPDLFQEMRPLSNMDFAVIDVTVGSSDNLQCIWCGMFMDVDSIAMHFHEIHPEEVEVPNCRLCLHELVANARYQEKFGENLEVTLPDEHHFRCGRFNLKTSTESAMDRAVAREMKRQADDQGGSDAEVEDEDPIGPEPFANSRMNLGKRSRPKRQFIMPALRQAAPMNSDFIEPVSDCHWICKICNGSILAAVISAGAIKHFRQHHPDQLERMQFELCKARLGRVSDGCMEFLSSTEIECLICNMTYPLHKPYNISFFMTHLDLHTKRVQQHIPH